MDIVLFILVLVFRGNKENTYNYTAIVVLSIIGSVLCLCMIPTYGAIILVSIALYVLTLILALSANNKK